MTVNHVLCAGAIASLASLPSGCAGSFRPLSARDWTMQSALFAESIIDAEQTVGITKNCTEANPLVGRCGQRMPEVAAGAVMLGAELLVTWALPRRWRMAWEGLCVGAEGLNIIRNDYEGFAPGGPGAYKK